MANKNTAVSASSETAVGEELNTKRKKARRIRKRRSLLFDFLKLAAFSVLLVYSVGVIISTQADIAQQEAKTRQRADFSDQRLFFAFAEVTENLFLQTVPNHRSGVFRQKRYRPLE